MSLKHVARRLARTWPARGRDDVARGLDALSAHALASPKASASLRKYSGASAGLLAKGRSCFLVATNPQTDGELSAVGEGTFGALNGSVLASKVRWIGPTTLDSDMTLAARINRVPFVVKPPTG